MSFESDINERTARNAFYNTSFDPEKRGEQMRQEYANTMQGDYDRLSEYADTDEKKELLESEFARYRQGYRDRYTAWLIAHSRCASTMITGGSNFNVRRNNKANNTERKRSDEVCDFRKRALDAITKKLRPELAPIMSGDGNAVERLQAKITGLEVQQARMKAVNAAHKAYMKNPESLDKSDLSEDDKTRIRTYKPMYLWEPHPFAPFEFTNLSATIRTAKKRLEGISRVKEIAPTAIENDNGITLEDCPADNRIRLTFPGKPSEEVRARLKHNGFRWTPSLGLWQAYRNYHSMETAKQIAKGE